jgi:uncharacterized protein (DUF58 family)
MTLLPQTTINRLTRARLKVYRAKMGTKQGSHKSLVTGCSNDFAQHRQYTPGDEPKRIDWRVLARTNRLMVRQYDQETNLRATLLIDSSASMGYRDSTAHNSAIQTSDKLTHAKRLAAALAWILIRQGDAVGIMSYANRINCRSIHASTVHHLHRLLSSLEQIAPQSTGDSVEILHKIADALPPRGLMVLISDLFLDPLPLRDVLSHFQHRNHELIVMQVMASDEVNFPFADSLRFRNLEGHQQFFEADSLAIRQEYKSELNKHLQSIKQICSQVQADYVFTTTDDDIAEVVNTFLESRQRRSTLVSDSRGNSV